VRIRLPLRVQTQTLTAEIILKFLEDNMIQLRKVGAWLGAVGRCALVGMLVGMLATQAVAEGATPVSSQSPAKPETTSVPNNSQIDQINLTTTANLPLVTQNNAAADVNALPDAPMESAGTGESSSLTMPPELKAMMDDAKQNSQNLEPAAANKPHGLKRPGMLILGIVGIPIAVMGGGILAIKGTEREGLRITLGTSFLVGGAAMTGFGFYFAYKPQKQ
jgi:hypothetical protein